MRLITEMLWALIARIAARPRVTAWLVRRAERRPYLHIGEYMRRYWLVPESWRLPFAVRINHIKREDLDPYLHDHPWPWRTIILRGWYVEEDVCGAKTLHMQGTTRAASAETLHRIDEVPPEGVWTMFITGRRRNEWGFMVADDGRPPRKVHWREYVSPNSREAS